ncbi:transposase [Candidatus Sumerlaeota bacterium]|nr:transposase [Candidatus Sumerlaeota bacterium]
MKNWVPVDRGQALLLPPSVDELLPADHMARFVVEVVESLDISAIVSKYERRGRGSTPYHPAMMLALLFYGYATGVMSSRRIERACQFDLAFRYIAAGATPDHDTIVNFRRRNLEEIAALFLDILRVAREMGLVKVGTVAIDGTKVKANASKHAAASYKRAKEIEVQLRSEIERLMKMAEGADNEPIAEGIDIPAEIARREDRMARMIEAQRAIELRHAEMALVEHGEQLAENPEKVKNAMAKCKRPPDPPEPPSPTPSDTMQHNFTDPESRIMPDKGAFSQCYNAQASVDTETMLIVGQHITQCANDKRELLVAISVIASVYGAPNAVIADAGYYSEDAVSKSPVDVYVSPGRTKHNRSLSSQLAKPAEGQPPPNATAAEKMRHKIDTKEGRATYRLRKMTVEPVFGIIKSAMGFRQFLLRGVDKARGEWGLVCLAYNLKRMYGLRRAS